MVLGSIYQATNFVDVLKDPNDKEKIYFFADKTYTINLSNQSSEEPKAINSLDDLNELVSELFNFDLNMYKFSNVILSSGEYHSVIGFLDLIKSIPGKAFNPVNLGGDPTEADLEVRRFIEEFSQAIEDASFREDILGDLKTLKHWIENGKCGFEVNFDQRLLGFSFLLSIIQSDQGRFVLTHQKNNRERAIKKSKNPIELGVSTLSKLIPTSRMVSNEFEGIHNKIVRLVCDSFSDWKSIEHSVCFQLIRDDVNEFLLQNGF